MAEADLSPTTFTSSLASDSDYDISLRIHLKIYAEASTDNYHQTQKAVQSLRSAEVRRCQSRSTGSSCHPVELISDQTIENNSQEMAACLFSRKRRSRGHEQELREELLQSPQIRIENYPSRKAFATHLSDGQSFIYFFRLNQWLL